MRYLFVMMLSAAGMFLPGCQQRTNTHNPIPSSDPIQQLPAEPRLLLEKLVYTDSIKTSPFRSIVRLRQMLQRYPSSQDSLTAAMLCFEIGQAYSIVDEHDSVIRYMELASAYWDWHPNNKIRAKIYYDLGRAYRVKSNIMLSVKYLNLAGLEISQVVHHDTTDRPYYAYMYYEIGKTIADAKDYETAQQYLRKSLLLLNPATDEGRYYQIVDLLEMARIYSEQRLADSARGYLARATTLLEQTPDSSLLAGLYDYQAGYYYFNKDYLSAAIYGEKGLDLMQRNNTSPDHLAAARYSVAGAWLDAGKPERAGYLLELSKNYYDTASEQPLDELADLSENFTKYYILENQPQQAYRQFSRFVELKEQLYNKERHQINQQMVTLYNLREKDQRITQLREVEQKSGRVVRQRNIWLGGLASLMLVSGITALLFWRFHRLKEQAAKSGLETQLLRSQMNPHFIFNTLSALQGLIADGNNQKAAGYLSLFGKLLRTILENSRDNLVPLRQEIDALEDYLQLQQLRFGHSFTYFINIRGFDNDEEDVLIPPMLLQPFVENAIHHGKIASNGGYVKIEVTKGNRVLVCVIEDDGIGLSAAHRVQNGSQSMSTNIVRERLRILGKERRLSASLNIKQGASGSGTVVNLVIPFIY